ncbi:MAG: Holliday junction resolvase RuvX [Bacteroidota bacterium]|jgi:putative Holliday junction resolvase
MGRILAIDFGNNRTGLAVTDPLKIIASPLIALDTQKLYTYLQEYMAKETVETIVIGLPLNSDGSPTDATPGVDHCRRRLRNLFPTLPIVVWDESYTSKQASREMINMGMKKKDRQKKENTDLIAATLLLQDYLEKNSL